VIVVQLLALIGLLGIISFTSRGNVT